MTGSEVLPEAVRRLVQSDVPTPAHLEALVAVAREPEREWRAEEVAAGKYADGAVVAGALRDLAARGLLDEIESGEGVKYRAAAKQREVLRQLIGAYDRVPVQLVRAVYARPSDSVQSFSDAFRIKRPE